MKEARAKTKSRDAKRARSFDSGCSKGSLGIQDKTRLKKRGFNQVPSKFPKAHDDRGLTLSLGREGVLAHQTRIKIVKSVAKSILANALRERIIVLVVSGVFPRLGIAIM